VTKRILCVIRTVSLWAKREEVKAAKGAPLGIRVFVLHPRGRLPKPGSKKTACALGFFWSLGLTPWR